MNFLFRSLRANLRLAVWTSRRVSPRAKRVARKRSPGLDWRFGMTPHYRLCNVLAEAKTLRQEVRESSAKPNPVGEDEPSWFHDERGLRPSHYGSKLESWGMRKSARQIKNLSGLGREKFLSLWRFATVRSRTSMQVSHAPSATATRSILTSRNRRCGRL